MADGYHSKKPKVSNCAIILLRDDMPVSYLWFVTRDSLDKVVVAMFSAIIMEAMAKSSKFSIFTNMVSMTSLANLELK